MADEDRRAILPGKNTARRRHVVLERGQRVLHDADGITATGQFLVDAAPARTVGEGAVNENDVADRFRLSADGTGRQRKGGAGSAARNLIMGVSPTRLAHDRGAYPGEIQTETAAPERWVPNSEQRELKGANTARG